MTQYRFYYHDTDEFSVWMNGMPKGDLGTDDKAIQFARKKFPQQRITIQKLSGSLGSITTLFEQYPAKTMYRLAYDEPVYVTHSEWTQCGQEKLTASGKANWPGRGFKVEARDYEGGPVRVVDTTHSKRFLVQVAGPIISDEMRKVGREEMSVETDTMIIKFIIGPGWSEVYPDN